MSVGLLRRDPREKPPSPCHHRRREVLRGVKLLRQTLIRSLVHALWPRREIGPALLTAQSPTNLLRFPEHPKRQPVSLARVDQPAAKPTLERALDRIELCRTPAIVTLKPRTAAAVVARCSPNEVDGAWLAPHPYLRVVKASGVTGASVVTASCLPSDSKTRSPAMPICGLSSGIRRSSDHTLF